MARGMKRYKRRKSTGSGGSLKANPPLMSDLVEWVLPGFGGFAATRFVTRVAATQVAKRWPGFAKHAGAASSIGSFLSAWYFAGKVKQLEKYHTPIVVGSAIAAIQSLVQLYLPKLGWIVSDASPELAAAADTQQLAAPAATADDGLDLIADEDEGWYVYNDGHDAGRYATTPNKPSAPPPKPRSAAASAQQQAAAPGSDEDIFDILEDDNMQGDSIFAQN